MGESRIAIGSDVYIGSDSWLQVLGPADESPAIVIGDGTSIAGHCVLSARTSIRLGRRVLVARNVYIADHQHAFEDTGRAVLDQGVERIAPIEIADGAWLGQNVVVGPGVRIGRGAVVGANAVVLADVPDHSVAVGAPARVVRSFEPAADLPS
jgi:lipopolysaccharide O-acetyltransferase